MIPAIAACHSWYCCVMVLIQILPQMMPLLHYSTTGTGSYFSSFPQSPTCNIVISAWHRLFPFIIVLDAHIPGFVLVIAFTRITSLVYSLSSHHVEVISCSSCFLWCSNFQHFFFISWHSHGINIVHEHYLFKDFYHLKISAVFRLFEIKNFKATKLKKILWGITQARRSR